MTDAKAIDAQYGMEKGITSMAAALAGGNLIYESTGMTASLLGASFEAFVLDDEMHSNTCRALRGIEVTDENLAFDTICDTVLGPGHFVGAQETYAAMERDYFYCRLRIGTSHAPEPKKARRMPGRGRGARRRPFCGIISPSISRQNRTTRSAPDSIFFDLGR